MTFDQELGQRVIAEMKKQNISRAVLSEERRLLQLRENEIRKVIRNDTKHI